MKKMSTRPSKTHMHCISQMPVSFTQRSLKRHAWSVAIIRVSMKNTKISLWWCAELRKRLRRYVWNSIPDTGVRNVVATLRLQPPTRCLQITSLYTTASQDLRIHDYLTDRVNVKYIKNSYIFQETNNGILRHTYILWYICVAKESVLIIW
jgi:hypothetical protein